MALVLLGEEMSDMIDKAARSALMAKVRTKNTQPELLVRKIAFSMGYRYRLHQKELPGTPDLVFPGRRKVIFVHGCFWHAHSCRRGRAPSSNTEYWLPKLARNVTRDKKVRSELVRQGWKVLVIWECQLKKPATIARRIQKFLDSLAETPIVRNSERSPAFVEESIERPL